MTTSRFIARIDSGKANNLVYSLDGEEGLESVWKYEGAYFLTWEECSAGEQYDESNYTRDEQHEFRTVEQMIAFLKDHGLKVEAFKP